MKIAKPAAVLLMIAASVAACAQAVPSATEGHFSLTAGAIASGFRPDYATPDPLFGAGTYVDIHFSHWFQLEAEGRWMRFNEFYGEHQDNYLIGPRIPIKQFGRAQIFGKALIGLGRMQFPAGDVYAFGSYTAIVAGGTVDYRLSPRWSLRALDVEYQNWPVWPGAFPLHPAPGTEGYGNYNKSLQPYGISVGIGYRIF